MFVFKGRGHYLHLVKRGGAEQFELLDYISETSFKEGKKLE